jgi:UDP-2,3-diacylglucosamine pyrophosphatase LpxH
MLEPSIIEVAYSVSDQHLGEGARMRLPYRTWRRHVRSFFGMAPHAPETVEVDNPLEDFVADEEFAAFVAHLGRLHADASVLTLRLLGDVFDPMAVRYRGRLVDPPYEDPAAEKMRTIIAGHPTYFAALAAFVRLPNARLDMFVGNHDLFLAWPGVQEVLRAQLAGDDAALRGKLRFFDGRRRFELVEHGVLYYHGHNAEEAVASDPERIILLPAESGLRAPVLNVPYGSFLVSDVVSALKRRNVLVGRAHSYQDVLSNAVRYRWGWMVFSVYAFLWSVVRHAFFGVSGVQRRGGFFAALRIVRAGFDEKPLDRYAVDLLAARQAGEGLRGVVMGHSHDARRMTTPAGVYVNTGTWTPRYSLVPPHVEFRWPWPLRPFEWPLRVVQFVARRRRLPYANAISVALGLAGSVSVVLAVASLRFREDIAPYLPPSLDGRWDIAGVVALLFFAAGVAVQFVAARPALVSSSRFTCARARHFADGTDDLRLLEWHPATSALVDAGDEVV